MKIDFLLRIEASAFEKFKGLVDLCPQVEMVCEGCCADPRTAADKCMACAKVVTPQAGCDTVMPQHFPLNRSEAEGRQWYDFLKKEHFIGADADEGSWLYLLGFTATAPAVLRPIEWLKTLETARMMICKIHGNLIESKQLSKAEMKMLAAACFNKRGEPLSLSKPRKEISVDADLIENFFPTLSDL